MFLIVLLSAMLANQMVQAQGLIPGYLVKSLFDNSLCDAAQSYQTNSTGSLINFCYPAVCSGNVPTCQSSLTQYVSNTGGVISLQYKEFTSADCSGTELFSQPVTYGSACDATSKSYYSFLSSATYQDSQIPGVTTLGGPVIKQTTSPQYCASNLYFQIQYNSPLFCAGPQGYTDKTFGAIEIAVRTTCTAYNVFGYVSLCSNGVCSCSTYVQAGNVTAGTCLYTVSPLSGSTGYATTTCYLPNGAVETKVPTPAPTPQPSLAPVTAAPSAAPVTAAPTYGMTGYFVQTLYQSTDCTGQTNSTAYLIGVCYPGVCNSKAPQCQSSLTAYASLPNSAFSLTYYEFTTADCSGSVFFSSPQNYPATGTCVPSGVFGFQFAFHAGSTFDDTNFPQLTTLGGIVIRQTASTQLCAIGYYPQIQYQSPTFCAGPQLYFYAPINVYIGILQTCDAYTTYGAVYQCAGADVTCQCTGKPSAIGNATIGTCVFTTSPITGSSGYATSTCYAAGGAIITKAPVSAPTTNSPVTRVPTISFAPTNEKVPTAANELSNTAIIGIVVGVGGGLILIGVAIAVYLYLSMQTSAGALANQKDISTKQQHQGDFGNTL